MKSSLILVCLKKADLSENSLFRRRPHAYFHGAPARLSESNWTFMPGLKQSGFTFFFYLWFVFRIYWASYFIYNVIEQVEISPSRSRPPFSVNVKGTRFVDSCGPCRSPHISLAVCLRRLYKHPGFPKQEFQAVRRWWCDASMHLISVPASVQITAGRK